jgi:hypothetical protein
MFHSARANCLIKQADLVVAPAVLRVFDSTAHLEAVYPGFNAWFEGKVVAGLRDGSRRLFVESAGGQLTGVAIAKRTTSERKLCTLWVAPKTRNEGVAAHLANEVFDWLGTTKPLFTVPDIRIKEFASLLSRWGFVESQVVQDLYRPASQEFVFNGLLRRLS